MRWLLPDGIDELLPERAALLETNRRLVIDLFVSKGYQLVIPPLVEFTDSLLTGSGIDLDSTTAKLTDPNSGKTMGIRADITPQTARMDAHSMKSTGSNKLCYASTLLRMQTEYPNQNRTPMQIGIEHYGDASIKADIEVISILMNMLSTLGIKNTVLDLGHCGFLSSILSNCTISENGREQLIAILHKKSQPDLNAWIEQSNLNYDTLKLLNSLMQLYGNNNFLGSEPLQQFIAQIKQNTDSTIIANVDNALTQLQQISAELKTQFPNINLFYDLAEVRGFHYHTGVIFAAFHPSCGHMIANGGRYDNIGEAFGNARPATGYSADLKLLTHIANTY